MKIGEVYTRVVDGRPRWARVFKVSKRFVRWALCDAAGKAGGAAVKQKLTEFEAQWVFVFDAGKPTKFRPVPPAEDFEAAKQFRKISY